MKFGLSLSGLLQHSRDADMAQRLADVLHLVRVARDLGFDYIYAGQHYLSHPFQMLQPLVSLARIGAETGDMDLLSTVLVPLQNPVQMAEDVASLDVITNGRVIVNAALGYRDEEYEAFGVTREDRIARMSPPTSSNMFCPSNPSVSGCCPSPTHPLRFLFATRPAVLTQVLGIVYRALSTFLVRRAGLRSGAGARTGAVTLIQRFGSALNLNPHLHMLFLDGAYTRAG